MSPTRKRRDAPGKAPDHRIIDLQRLALLDSMAHGEVRSIINEFVASMSSRSDEIEQAWRAGDLKTATRLVHRLAGAAMNCCFPGLAAHCLRWAEDGEADWIEQLDLLELRIAECREHWSRVESDGGDGN